MLFGPIDPSSVFCMGTPLLVAAETRNILERFPKGGLVIKFGCAIPAEAPPENIYAFAEMVRNHSKPNHHR